MDDHLKEALDIVKAQASVRIMSEDEIISMVRRLSSDIKNVAEGESCVEELVSADVQSDPRKSESDGAEHDAQNARYASGWLWIDVGL